MDRVGSQVKAKGERVSPYLGRAATGRRRTYYIAKRVMDVILTALLLVLFAPVMLAVALAVRLDSPGKIIFSQDRMGYDWRTGQLRPFKFLKFRSMYENIDQSVHKEYIKSWINGTNGNGANGHNKQADLRHDRRMTRVGRILRRTSLDELPQLWNVMRGDMSLVGPRPVPLYEVSEYEPWHMARLAATPGITGAWQVRCRGRGTIDEMAGLDIEYIENQSLWLDIKILVLTIPAVITGSGAA